jgi:hypothetical protein
MVTVCRMLDQARGVGWRSEAGSEVEESVFLRTIWSWWVGGLTGDQPELRAAGTKHTDAAFGTDGEVGFDDVVWPRAGVPIPIGLDLSIAQMLKLLIHFAHGSV